MIIKQEDPRALVSPGALKRRKRFHRRSFKLLAKRRETITPLCIISQLRFLVKGRARAFLRGQFVSFAIKELAERETLGEKDATSGGTRTVPSLSYTLSSKLHFIKRAQQRTEAASTAETVDEIC